MFAVIENVEGFLKDKKYTIYKIYIGSECYMIMHLLLFD